MAKQQHAPDQFAKTGRALVSSVKQLRGWVSSDESKKVDLVDALNALTAHRLVGRAFGEAAADAQDAVLTAAQVVASFGPLGPYTPLPDAARYLTAGTHMAAVQAGVNLPEAGGRTMQGLVAWKAQLTSAGVEDALDALTVVWALATLARGALAEGNVALANAFADEAWERAGTLPMADEPELTSVALDCLRLVADTRWAAGLAMESTMFARRARHVYDGWAGGELAHAARLSAGQLARLVAPAVGVYSGLAARSAAQDDHGEAIEVRADLVELLSPLAARQGDAGRASLAQAQAELAAALLAGGRSDDAIAPAAEAMSTVDALVAKEKPVGSMLGTQLGVAAVWGRVLASSGRGAEAAPALTKLITRAKRLKAAQERPLALAGVHAALATAATGDQASAAAAAASKLVGGADVDAALAQAASGLPAIHDGAVTWERLSDADAWRPSARVQRDQVSLDAAVAAAAEQRRLDMETERQRTAEQAERDRAVAEQAAAARAERERLAAEQAEREHQEAERLAAEQAEAERLAAEQAERERQEAERLAAEQAEANRLAAEQAEANRLAAEQAEANRLAAEQAEANRLAAEQAEAERLAAEQAERERQEAERLAAEQAEANRLAAEQAEAERLAAQQAEAERLAAEQAEAERLAAEQAERERQEAERLAAQQAGRDRLAAEQRQQDEVDALVTALSGAQAEGGRRNTRAAAQALVDHLRPLVDADPARYGALQVQALEELATARRRLGDLWGARGPAKEARDLADRLGL